MPAIPELDTKRTFNQSEIDEIFRKAIEKN